MGQLVEVKVPDIGDFKEVEVIEVLVKPGDTVAKEQSLVTVESDKASMEIPSSAAGVVKELKIKLGDKVSEGALLLVLDAAAGAPARRRRRLRHHPRRRRRQRRRPHPRPLPHPCLRRHWRRHRLRRPRSSVPTRSTPRWARDRSRSNSAPRARKPHASPSVRKFARELGVDLQYVAGSGTKGRITPDDVRQHVKAVMASGARPAAAPAAAAAPGLGMNLPPWPAIDFSKFGPVERVAMSRIRKISGPSLTRNAIVIPHVTNHDDADITELEAFRVQLNKENERNKDAPKLTMLAFLVKACVAALKKYPSSTHRSTRTPATPCS